VAPPRSRGVFLLEALVSLAILGIVLMLGAGFLARRRALEADRRDRDRAARALASEWIYLRTAFRGDLTRRTSGRSRAPASSWTRSTRGTPS
jgi:hypothetical protein